MQKISIAPTAEQLAALPLYKDADSALVTFKAEMSKLFPNSMNAANRSTNLGGGITLSFMGAPDAKSTPNGISMNDNAYSRFMIHLSDNSGKPITQGPIELEILASSNINARSTGIKFRKIKANSVSEAVTKLLAWFKANKPAIDAIITAQYPK